MSQLKAGARIDRIFLGLWPPFDSQPRLVIPASAFHDSHDSREGAITCVNGLGYSDGVVVQPFNTPSYEPSAAPYVDYVLDLQPTDRSIELRTLPTLHVYEGRDARYALQLGHHEPQVFSIHAADFTAEWRLNVLRGYSSRTISIPANSSGRQRLRVYLLDPGIVLQEIIIR